MSKKTIEQIKMEINEHLSGEYESDEMTEVFERCQTLESQLDEFLRFMDNDFIKAVMSPLQYDTLQKKVSELSVDLLDLKHDFEFDSGITE